MFYDTLEVSTTYPGWAGGERHFVVHYILASFFSDSTSSAIELLREL